MEARLCLEEAREGADLAGDGKGARGPRRLWRGGWRSGRCWAGSSWKPAAGGGEPRWGTSGHIVWNKVQNLPGGLKSCLMATRGRPSTAFSASDFPLATSPSAVKCLVSPPCFPVLWGFRELENLKRSKLGKSGCSRFCLLSPHEGVCVE